MCLLTTVTRTRVSNHLNNSIVIQVKVGEEVMKSYTVESGSRKVFRCEKLALKYLNPSITIICPSYSGSSHDFDYRAMRTNMEIRLRERNGGQSPYILMIRRRSFFSFRSSTDHQPGTTHTPRVTYEPRESMNQFITR